MFLQCFHISTWVNAIIVPLFLVFTEEAIDIVAHVIHFKRKPLDQLATVPLAFLFNEFELIPDEADSITFTKPPLAAILLCAVQP